VTVGHEHVPDPQLRLVAQDALDDFLGDILTAVASLRPLGWGRFDQSSHQRRSVRSSVGEVSILSISICFRRVIAVPILTRRGVSRMFSSTACSSPVTLRPLRMALPDG
jgi:hypothetical protein